MKRLVIKPALTVMLLAAALMGGAHAKAQRADPGDGQTSSKKVKKSGGGQVKFLRGSEESTNERSRRLMRECKGRVNAGACAGYTQ
ncbi:MAG: hypothetical protein ABIV07_08515 [Polaromonas sp.]